MTAERAGAGQGGAGHDGAGRAYEPAMRRALELAAHGPATGANPQVGCVLLVKLRQLRKHEVHRVVIDRAFSRCILGTEEQQHEVPLHAGDGEHTALVRVPVR